MATANYVPLICYYDGVLQNNTTRDPIYVGGDTRVDRVNKNISFTQFVTKMHELCISSPSQTTTTIDIKCRYLLDQHTSIAMHVKDDNSLSVIMDLHPHHCNAIVVYVEKFPAHKSSVAATPSKPIVSDNVVIDMYSAPSNDSSSITRCNKIELEKKVGISSESKLEQFLKSTEGNADSSLLRLRKDAVHFEIFSTNSKSWFGMRILDPKDSYLQTWNKIFVLSCMLALALDALFFYTPGIDGKMSCLNWDKGLEITACVLRSITDSIYIIHIIFQFHTGFFVPSSRAFGRGEFIEDLGVIARRYLSSFFIIDILAVLPIPQVLVLILMPQTSGSIDMRKRNSLRYLVLLQYIPRFLRIYPLYKELRRVNTMIKTTWAGVVFNFSLYMLASHIFGAIWYFLSVERQTICWRDACSNTTTCHLYSLYCGDHNRGGNEFLQVTCPIIEPNTTLFDFGIYLDALQSGIPKSSFPEKLIYCFWWGLQNIGSLGQNLKTSAYIWEVCFAVCISVFGLFLFMLLIGNVQTYLQSDTVKSEKDFRKKLQDTEQWMSRKFLPEDLRRRIRQFELFIWQTTRGFNEESLLLNLPKDIKRDIKRHLCLALLMEVPMFEKLDEQLLDALCNRLKPVLYTEDSFIIREGDPVDEMLFIMRGELLRLTTNCERHGFLNPRYLKAGDFLGEELLTWAIAPQSPTLPISTRTVQALKEVEAFSLMADDLKFVVSQFWRLDRKRLRHAFRFYSQQWRTWAACFIQSSWRRYRRHKLKECVREKENKLSNAFAQTGGGSSRLGTNVYASRFATNALRSIRRHGT